MDKEIVLNIDGSHNGHNYVDLGLQSGTMWATCNVGADKPEDPGLLFQWGRIDGYMYNDKNHKFKTNEQNLEDGSTGEYIPVLSTGNKYDKGETLKLEDDAVHINMGGKWYMPTLQQYQEMFNNTTHMVIKDLKTQKDIGMLFTSVINGCQLLIPFAGFWYNGSFDALGFLAYVWSSDVHSSLVNNAYRLYCRSSSGYADVDINLRTGAFSVRGVFRKY